jgi:hypothetical protein
MNNYEIEPVRLLPQEEFAKLSQEAKLAYITRTLRELTRHTAAMASTQTPAEKPHKAQKFRSNLESARNQS